METLKSGQEGSAGEEVPHMNCEHSAWQWQRAWLLVVLLVSITACCLVSL
jgi:hypothetical protein